MSSCGGRISDLLTRIKRLTWICCERSGQRLSTGEKSISTGNDNDNDDVDDDDNDDDDNDNDDNDDDNDTVSQQPDQVMHGLGQQEER